jgi:hypothetical protein
MHKQEPNMASGTKSEHDTKHDEPKRAATATAAASTPFFPERTEEQKAQIANDSVGAQVILEASSLAALASRGGAGSSIEENSALHIEGMPRIVGLSRDSIGGTVSGKKGPEVKLHRPVPWYEPPAALQTSAEVRAEAIAQIVSP